MTLVQVCHDDALTFWDNTVVTNEFAVFAQGVDLVQRELILLGLVRDITHMLRVKDVLGRGRED